VQNSLKYAALDNSKCADTRKVPIRPLAWTVFECTLCNHSTLYYTTRIYEYIYIYIYTHDKFICHKPELKLERDWSRARLVNSEYFHIKPLEKSDEHLRWYSTMDRSAPGINVGVSPMSRKRLKVYMRLFLLSSLASMKYDGNGSKYIDFRRAWNLRRCCACCAWKRLFLNGVQRRSFLGLR